MNCPVPRNYENRFEVNKSITVENIINSVKEVLGGLDSRLDVSTEDTIVIGVFTDPNKRSDYQIIPHGVPIDGTNYKNLLTYAFTITRIPISEEQFNRIYSKLEEKLASEPQLIQ